jgi:hypothetical protein
MPRAAHVVNFDQFSEIYFAFRIYYVQVLRTALLSLVSEYEAFFHKTALLIDVFTESDIN